MYATGLLLAPLLAIFWGALAEGFGAVARELRSADAVSSLKLTLIMAVSATVINTAFGLCIAWVLVRDKFWGRRILNGLVDMPFAVSPVIAGFMLIRALHAEFWRRAVQRPVAFTQTRRPELLRRSQPRSSGVLS